MSECDLEEFKKLNYTDHIILVYTYYFARKYKRDPLNIPFPFTIPDPLNIPFPLTVVKDLTLYLNVFDDSSSISGGCNEEERKVLIKDVVKNVVNYGITNKIIYTTNIDIKNLDKIFECYKYLVNKNPNALFRSLHVANNLKKLVNYIVLLSDMDISNKNKKIPCAGKTGLPYDRDSYFCYPVIDSGKTKKPLYYISTDLREVIPEDLVTEDTVFYVNCNNPIITKLTNRVIGGPPQTNKCEYGKHGTELLDPEEFNISIYKLVVHITVQITGSENVPPAACPIATVNPDVTRYKRYVEDHLGLLTLASKSLKRSCEGVRTRDDRFGLRCIFRNLLQEYRYMILHLSDGMSDYDYQEFSPAVTYDFAKQFNELAFVSSEYDDVYMTWEFKLQGAEFNDRKFLLKSSTMASYQGALFLLHDLTVGMILGMEPNNTINVLGSFVCNPPVRGVAHETLCSGTTDMRVNAVVEIPVGYSRLSDIKGGIADEDLAVIIKKLHGILSHLFKEYNFHHNNLVPSNVYFNRDEKEDKKVMIGGFELSVMRYGKISINPNARVTSDIATATGDRPP